MLMYIPLSPVIKATLCIKLFNVQDIFYCETQAYLVYMNTELMLHQLKSLLYYIYYYTSKIQYVFTVSFKSWFSKTFLK